MASECYHNQYTLIDKGRLQCNSCGVRWQDGTRKPQKYSLLSTRKHPDHKTRSYGKMKPAKVNPFTKAYSECKHTKWKMHDRFGMFCVACGIPEAQHQYNLHNQSITDTIEAKEERSMNLNNVAALLRDDTTTIRCVFDPLDSDIHLDRMAKKYTFKCTKELAETLERGDAVIADTTNGYRIVYVAGLDEELNIEPNSSINYSYIFQKVDDTSLHTLKSDDETIITKLKDAQRQNVRDQALTSLGIDDPKTLLKRL